jgi:SAM-dependent methyltransferase
VFLAAAGWSVVAVDRLEDALHRGERFANGALGRDFAARIEWRQMDLLRSVAQGPFDLIYALFWFDREALRAHARELVPGGRLVVEAFTDAHFAATGRPTSPDRRIRIGELQGLMPDLEFVAGNEAFRSGRHTARAVWRSRP